MLMPSIGCWVTPFTTAGWGSCAASRIVGTMSMTWWNCERISPRALMPFGQEMTMPLRVPPKWLATCLVHWNGVFIAQAQGTGYRLDDFQVPKSGRRLSR